MLYRPSLLDDASNASTFTNGIILTMSVKIRIPTTLRPLTAGEAEVDVDPGTVAEVLASLETAHPGFGSKILDDEGNLRRFVNVFVSDEDVRFLDGINTVVEDGAQVAIIPAVAGGF